MVSYSFAVYIRNKTTIGLILEATGEALYSLNKTIAAREAYVTTAEMYKEKI